MRNYLYLLNALLTLTVFSGIPALGDDQSFAGPVKTVRGYGARYKLQNSNWVPTDRQLNRVAQYNRAGQLTEEEWYNANGQLETKQIYRYDAKGRKTEEITYRPYDVEPYLEERAVYVQRTVYVYDSKGRVKQVEYYRSDSALRGIHTFAYDEKNQKVADCWYDARGERVQPRDLFSYNGRGQLTGWRGHDTRGAPEIHRYEYDANGRRIAEITQWEGNGATKNTFRYDKKGNRIETRIGVRDDRFAEKNTSAYDDHGNITESARYRYDELTLWLTTATHYDAEGRVIDVTATRPEGTVDHRTTYLYNADGKVIEEARYSANNYFDGKTVYTYNTTSRLSEKANYDGEILNNRTVYQYDMDTQGELLSETQYDEEGKLLGILTYTRDAEGRLSMKTWQEASGKITETWSYLYRDDVLAEEIHTSTFDSTASREVTRFNEGGDIIEHYITAADGSVLSRVYYQYRPDGRLVKVVRRSGDDSLIGSTEYVYDSSDNRAEEKELYGDDSLQEKTTRSYDAEGREIEAVQYFGQQMGPKLGYRYQYDAYGNIIETVTGEITLRYGERYLRPMSVYQQDITYWE